MLIQSTCLIEYSSIHSVKQGFRRLRTKALILGASMIMMINIGNAIAAPTEWKVSEGGNGHLYEVIVQPSLVTWEQAQSIALSKEGYLATLTSAAENDFVFALAAPDVIPQAWFPCDAFPFCGDTWGPWLGGFQHAGSPEPTGGWQWVNNDGDFLYTNWASGEPNDANPLGETWLHFFNNSSSWNDINQNTSPLPSFVVEISSPIPEPMTYALFLVGLGIITLRTRRFS